MMAYFIQAALVMCLCNVALVYATRCETARWESVYNRRFVGYEYVDRMPPNACKQTCEASEKECYGIFFVAAWGGCFFYYDSTVLSTIRTDMESRAKTHVYKLFCEEDYCSPTDPCLNGGTCDEDLDICDCDPGITGVNCEVAWCDPDPCLNDGVCDNVNKACICTGDFEGDICEIVIPPYCEPDPCENNGTCNDIDDICECTEGFAGEFCEIELFCTPDKCQNGGTCEEHEEGAGTCDCAEGFTGETCETDLFCEPNPCENGGECCEDFGVCVCPCAFEGELCETEKL